MRLVARPPPDDNQPMWWRRSRRGRPVAQGAERAEALETLDEMERLVVELVGIQREFGSGRAQVAGLRRRRQLLERVFDDHRSLTRLLDARGAG